MEGNEEISMSDVDIALGRMIGRKATGKNEVTMVIAVTEKWVARDNVMGFSIAELWVSAE